jgi:hypothetical protein
MPDFNVLQTSLNRGGFTEHLSPTLVAQQSVTKIITMIVMILGHTLLRSLGLTTN